MRVLAHEALDLFTVSDAPVLEALALYRTEEVTEDAQTVAGN